MNRVGVFIFALLFVACVNNDRVQRIAVAREILKSNQLDIDDLVTQQIKDPLRKATAQIELEHKGDCIIDSLAPKFADRHTLLELKEIQKGNTSSSSEITLLVTENSELCEQCLFVKK